MNVYKTHVRSNYVLFPGKCEGTSELRYWTNLMKQKHAKINNNKIQYNTARSEIGPSLTIKTIKILM